jgi:hypothetical protein
MEEEKEEKKKREFSTIDMDKINFKNNDVVKWTKFTPKKRAAVKAATISGLSSLAKRSKFRKR